MKAVVNGVVSLDVPAIVVLVHTVAVNPNDRRMLFGAVEIFGDEEPAGNLLAVRSGKAHELGLDELEMIDARRHGIGEANRLCVGNGRNREKVGAVMRVRVLVDEELVVR